MQALRGVHFDGKSSHKIGWCSSGTALVDCSGLAGPAVHWLAAYNYRINESPCKAYKHCAVLVVCPTRDRHQPGYHQATQAHRLNPRMQPLYMRARFLADDLGVQTWSVVGPSVGKCGAAWGGPTIAHTRASGLGETVASCLPIALGVCSRGVRPF